MQSDTIPSPRRIFAPPASTKAYATDSANEATEPVAKVQIAKKSEEDEQLASQYGDCAFALKMLHNGRRHKKPPKPCTPDCLIARLSIKRVQHQARLKRHFVFPSPHRASFSPLSTLTPIHACLFFHAWPLVCVSYSPNSTVSQTSTGEDLSRFLWFLHLPFVCSLHCCLSHPPKHSNSQHKQHLRVELHHHIRWA